MNAKEMSAFLMFRTPHPLVHPEVDEFFGERTPVRDSMELEAHLRELVSRICKRGGGSPCVKRRH